MELRRGGWSPVKWSYVLLAPVMCLFWAINEFGMLLLLTQFTSYATTMAIFMNASEQLCTMIICLVLRIRCEVLLSGSTIKHVIERRISSVVVRSE